MCFQPHTIENHIKGPQQCQFGRVLNITLKELICFTLSQLFGYT